MDRRSTSVGLPGRHLLWKRGHQAPPSCGKRKIPEHQLRIPLGHEESVQVTLRS